MLGDPERDAQLTGMRAWLQMAAGDVEPAACATTWRRAADIELRLGALEIGVVHLNVLVRAHFAAGAWDRGHRASPSARSRSAQSSRTSPRACSCGGRRRSSRARAATSRRSTRSPPAPRQEPTDAPDRVLAVGVARALKHAPRGERAAGPRRARARRRAHAQRRDRRAGLLALAAPVRRRADRARPAAEDADRFLARHEQLAAARDHAPRRPGSPSSAAAWSPRTATATPPSARSPPRSSSPSRSTARTSSRTPGSRSASSCAASAAAAARPTSSSPRAPRSSSSRPRPPSPAATASSAPPASAASSATTPSALTPQEITVAAARRLRALQPRGRQRPAAQRQDRRGPPHPDLREARHLLARTARRPPVTNPWRTTLLAGSASYLDAGSIVAGAVGLPLWTEHFGFGTSVRRADRRVQLQRHLSAGVGALVGGWLCDKLGRRRVYQWDLLLYAFGLLWIIFATEPWMLVFGYVFTGLAVGVDVPASWTLIAEAAPKGAHGRHGGDGADAVADRPARRAADRPRARRRRPARRAADLRPPARALARRLVPATKARRVTAVGESRRRTRGSRSRASSSSRRKPFRHAARDAHRDVRPVEPARRHERLLPAVHPHAPSARRRRPRASRSTRCCSCSPA